MGNMLSASAFDYWNELRLKGDDAGKLEKDVKTFIDAKTLSTSAHHLGDITKPDQTAFLVGDFLQCGLQREQADDVKPGQEYWIPPMEGESCSDLHWPEDVDRYVTCTKRDRSLSLTCSP